MCEVINSSYVSHAGAFIFKFGFESASLCGYFNQCQNRFERVNGSGGGGAIQNLVPASFYYSNFLFPGRGWGGRRRGQERQQWETDGETTCYLLCT